MLNPIITPPRVPLVDPDTGLINRAWYLFFLSLEVAANDYINNPNVGPSPESLIASYDAMLQTLAQEVETQPSLSVLVSQIAEQQKQINALSVSDENSNLLSQIAEQQKQIEALQAQIECPCLELTAELQAQIQALQLAPVPDTALPSSGATGILPVVNGGTGQSTFVDGELLIGNSTGNTLSKSTLTAGPAMSITNGSGTITLNATPFGSATASGANAAVFSALLPTGSASSTNLWAKITIGGTDYWLPIWAV